jgi:hypothetical protein
MHHPTHPLPPDLKAGIITSLASIGSECADLQRRITELIGSLASIPEGTPSPAISPSVQSEGEGNHGSDCDAQKAEASLAPQPARAADEAGALRHDQGNFVTDSGAGEGAPTPVDPVPAPDELFGAARDRVLGCYASTTLSVKEIAKKAGVPRNSVSPYLSMARRTGDPRVLKGDEARKERRKLAPLRIKSFLQKRLDEPQEPVRRLEPGSGRILVADVATLTIHGPTSSFRTSRPMVRTLAKLADGGVYDAKTLQEAGLWGSIELMRESFSRAVPTLEGAGIDLIKVGREMFKVRRAEADEVSA